MTTKQLNSLNRRVLVAKLNLKGFRVREIMDKTGLSSQYVYSILNSRDRRITRALEVSSR